MVIVRSAVSRYVFLILGVKVVICVGFIVVGILYSCIDGILNLILRNKATTIASKHDEKDKQKPFV